MHPGIPASWQRALLGQVSSAPSRGSQELLSNPNFGSIANDVVYHMHYKQPKEYERRVREQTAKYSVTDEED